jgi:hypothetical protein
MSISPEEDRIDRLLVTRQFALSHAGMTPFAAGHVDRCLALLLSSPSHPAVKLRPLLWPPGYHELLTGFRDRVILRIEGSAAVLIDALSFALIARLNARAAERTPRKHGRKRRSQVTPRAPKTPPLPTGSARR